MTKGQKQVPRLPCCRALIRAVQQQPVTTAHTGKAGAGLPAPQHPSLLPRVLLRAATAFPTAELTLAPLPPTLESGRNSEAKNLGIFSAWFSSTTFVAELTGGGHLPSAPPAAHLPPPPYSCPPLQLAGLL